MKAATFDKKFNKGEAVPVDWSKARRVNKLVVKGPTYFSPGDEKAFFDWLQAIPGISVGGKGRDLHVTLKRSPTDTQLRELLALFYRYRMNMKALAPFKTARNAKWFCQPEAFWYGRVFGRAKL